MEDLYDLVPTSGVLRPSGGSDEMTHVGYGVESVECQYTDIERF